MPFADVKFPDYYGQKLSLHDYFFAKSVDALRPGGVLALVTTHYTFDKQNSSIREILAAKADFLGAIRACPPGRLQTREAHVLAVVADISLFFGKRGAGAAGPSRRSRMAGRRTNGHRGRSHPDQQLLS